MTGPKPKPFPDGPLGQAAERFLIDVVVEGSLRPKSIPDYRSALRLLAEMYPQTPLSDFSGPAGTRLLMDFLASVPTASKKKRRAQLKSFFDYLVYFEAITVDPTARLKVPRSQAVTRTAQPIHQIQQLIDAQPETRDRLAIRMGYPLGLRRGAVRGIQMRHFDLDRDVVKIVLKGGRTTTQPLGFDVIRSEVRALREAGAKDDHFLLHVTRRTPLPKPHGSVTAFPTKPLSDTSFTYWWKQRFEIAMDVPYFDFHTLRTTSGTEMYRLTDGDAKATQNWLHHKSARTTLDHYVTEDMTKTLSALALWNQALSGGKSSTERSGQGTSAQQERHE